ncbi:hypothetical protein CRV05_14090, partial [Halarcobacter bivalviorum]
MDVTTYDSLVVLVGRSPNNIKLNLIVIVLVKHLNNNNKQISSFCHGNNVLITADIGNLYLAKQRGLTQSVSSKTLNENIPTHLRDEDGNWFAITKRARIFVYNPKNVNKADLGDYFSITKPQFKGKVITRTSTHAYNKSL